MKMPTKSYWSNDTIIIIHHQLERLLYMLSVMYMQEVVREVYIYTSAHHKEIEIDGLENILHLLSLPWFREHSLFINFTMV